MRPRYAGTSPGEVARWLISGALVIGVHGGAALALTSWSDSGVLGTPETAITLDLAAIAAAPTREQMDTPEPAPEPSKFEPEPQPNELEITKSIEPEPQPVVEKPPEPKLEPPPIVPKAEVILPPEPKQPPKEPKKKKVAALDQRTNAADRLAPRAAAPTAGQLVEVRTAFGALIANHLQRHKRYPAGASNSETNTVLLSFTLDRHGHVLGSHIAKGSGHAEFDREALDMLQRAQPFPTPPPELPDQRFAYTLPMRYTPR
jgi:protein TonB